MNADDVLKEIEGKPILLPRSQKYISKAIFKKRFGVEPEDDDLQRVNCRKTGVVGHFSCGICRKHKKPRFMCGCLVTKLQVKSKKTSHS